MSQAFDIWRTFGHIEPSSAAEKPVRHRNDIRQSCVLIHQFIDSKIGINGWHLSTTPVECRDAGGLTRGLQEFGLTDLLDPEFVATSSVNKARLLYVRRDVQALLEMLYLCEAMEQFGEHDFPFLLEMVFDHAPVLDSLHLDLSFSGLSESNRKVLAAFLASYYSGNDPDHSKLSKNHEKRGTKWLGASEKKYAPIDFERFIRLLGQGNSRKACYADYWQSCSSAPPYGESSFYQKVKDALAARAPSQ